MSHFYFDDKKRRVTITEWRDIAKSIRLIAPKGADPEEKAIACLEYDDIMMIAAQLIHRYPIPDIQDWEQTLGRQMRHRDDQRLYLMYSEQRHRALTDKVAENVKKGKEIKMQKSFERLQYLFESIENILSEIEEYGAMMDDESIGVAVNYSEKEIIKEALSILENKHTRKDMSPSTFFAFFAYGQLKAFYEEEYEGRPDDNSHPD